MEKLINEFSDSDVFMKKNTGGRPMIPVDKQVAIFIWFIATNETILNIADRFNQTLSATWNSIRRVSSALKDRASQFIKWPTGERIAFISNGFQEAAGIKEVIGATLST